MKLAPLQKDWSAIQESRLDWDHLPGRTPRACHPQSPATTLKGKRVLVTGGAGCIGGALARAITLLDPELLILLDASEQGIYEIEQALSERDAASPVIILGNLCDAPLLADIFARYQPQVVFHAAAIKHVPLLERHPFAAIANNALGTVDLAKAAIACGSEQLILVSSDKAADPCSIMGASKRIAEMVLFASPAAQTRMKAVRLGNVLGSPGSIVPLFASQIASGASVTITHPEARRYFMTTEQAVAALLGATSASEKSGLFIPEMGAPIRVLDLAKYMMATLATSGSTTSKIVFTALRPGDKLEERLTSQGESLATPADLHQDAIPLQPVISPSVSTETLLTAIDELRLAVQNRNLPAMLRTVMSLVSEYQPSHLLSRQIDATQTHAPQQASAEVHK